MWKYASIVAIATVATIALVFVAVGGFSADASDSGDGFEGTCEVVQLDQNELPGFLSGSQVHFHFDIPDLPPPPNTDIPAGWIGPPPSRPEVTEPNLTGNIQLDGLGGFTLDLEGTGQYFLAATFHLIGTGGYSTTFGPTSFFGTLEVRPQEGEFPNTNYSLDCTFDPPPNIFSITVLKLNDATNGPIPDWGMELFDNADCSGDPFDFGFTNDDGLLDFVNLPAGVYSVLEEEDSGFEPDDDNLCREDIAVGPANAAALPQGASEFVDCPVSDAEFPAAGCDEFNSGAQLNVEFVAGGDNFTVTLSGPTVVHRKSAPQDVAEFPAVGSAQPAGNGNGLDEVETEIIQLELTGDSIFGPITLRQSPERESIGMFEEQPDSQQGGSHPIANGVMDFPADSFFDVFAEVEIVGFGTLHNVDPVRLECVITEIPPLLCLYQPPLDEPVDLFDEDDVLIARLIHAAHVPLPLNEVFIVFRNVPVPDEWLIWCDVDCSGSISIIDALASARCGAGLPVPPPTINDPCPGLGDPVDGFIWGDIDCDGSISIIDALAIARFVAGLPVPPPTINEPCLSLEEHLEPPIPTADIKVVSFGSDEGPPYLIGSGVGPVNGWWPDYFTFDEVKHNNGPDPAEVEVWWFVEDLELIAGAQPNGDLTSVFTSFRWHAQPGDICTAKSLPLFSDSSFDFVPCGEGDVAGVPSINGDDCLDGIDNDGDDLIDFDDPDCQFDIDDLHFTVDLAVSSSFDLSRGLSVYCSGNGEFTFQTLNEQFPIDAEDPNLSNNDQAGEVTAECLPQF